MADEIGIQIDVWAGDLHQRHVGVEYFSDWRTASAYMAEQVEIGHLCCVLHTDFLAPPNRSDEAERLLAESYLGVTKNG